MTVYTDEKTTELRVVRCAVHGLRHRAHFGRCAAIVESTSYDSKRCGRPVVWVTVREGEGRAQPPPLTPYERDHKDMRV